MGEDPIPGVIVGHTNMDLDCFGSIALARHLFPGYLAIQSRHIHPMSRNLVIMYRDHLGLLPSGYLKGQKVKHLVVVDTRSEDRVKEYLDLLAEPPERMDPHDTMESTACPLRPSSLKTNLAGGAG